MIKNILYIILLISIISKPIGGYPPVDYVITNTAIDPISVYISSIPSGADIYINREYKGRTPITINLPEGSYSIKMNLTGYKSVVSDFSITSDMARQEISAILEPISPNTVIPIPTITTVETIPNIPKETFRVGPTVNLRPVKDDISKYEDGLIELYIDNPSVNDVIMNADVRISVPSGISVYGQGFGDAGFAGIVHGTFNIAPGKSRTIQMTIKAERTGEFLIKFSGLYWPGNNKDAFEPISLTHNFKVRDLSVPTVVTTPKIVNEGRFDIVRWFSDLLDKILGSAE